MYPVGFTRTPPKRTLSQNAGSDHYYFSLNSSNQEFTMDLTQNNTGGTIPVTTYSVSGRSPGKSSPTRSANPGGGRCVRELEEQLEELRKENFNLKLKIYFLEERFGRLYGLGEKADLAKNNIELQVEVESLKKELSDKVELLKQATVAIENLEKKQLSLRKEREDLGESLKSLEEELQKHRSHACPTVGNVAPFHGSSPMENSVALYLEAFGNRALDSEREFEKSRIESLEREIEDLRKAYKEQTEQLKSSRAQLETTEQSLMTKTKSLQSLEEDLTAKEEELTKLGQSLANTRKQIEDLNHQLSTQTQKYEGLSVDFGNKQERLNELESEVAVKDQRIKQLLSELSDWKEILKKKEAQVTMLQEELSKKEPEIEYKVQEIEQKDKIIEEKEGQIEQQNKILVEIQITLDEKQKQIEELENALKEKAKAIEELDGNLKKAGRTLQGFIQSKEKELESLSSDTKKKEKKIRDLTSELKEVKDMLNKAKWEAQTGRDDNVNSMAEEENENLAVQLGQKEEALAAADRQLRALNQRSQEIQRELEQKSQQLSELQKENNSLRSRRSSRSSSNCRKLTSVENTRHPAQDDLRKQLSDAMQQLNIVQAEKIDLMNEQAELRAKLNESSRKSNSSEVKDLQRQVKVKDAELERLQKDVARLKEETRKLREKESELENIRKELQKSKAMLSPKDQTPVKRRLEEREREIERLKVELQKLRSEKEESVKSTCEAQTKYETVLNELGLLKVELADVERLKQNLKDREKELSEMTNRVKQLDKELNEYYEFKSFVESEDARKEREFESVRIRIKQLESESVELSSLRAEIKQKTDEHKNLRESLERTKQLLAQAESNLESATSEGLVSKEVFDRVIREKNEKLSVLESTERALRHQIDSLKIECDMYRAKNSNDMVQSLLDETKRQQELVKKYKEEVVKLRKRLADSTNACDMLRTRLEEMADFLEEILNMDERGLVDLSSWSFKHKQKLHNSIAKSRELSRTLSQSLMIGIEDQDCELSVLDGFISSTSVSSWSVSRADDSRQVRVGQSEFMSMENSEIVNWNQSFNSRTAGQIIDSEVPGSRLCIVDRSLHNSQPIQSADYDVIANTEEHRKVAAKLSEELEVRMAELTTARRTVTEYERKVKDQNLIIENLKQTILKLEELSSKRESDRRVSSDNDLVHCDVSTQTVQIEQAIPVIVTEDASERREGDLASQEVGGALRASTSVTKSALYTASLQSSQVVVGKAETKIQQVTRESVGVVQWNRADPVMATPCDSPRMRELKFLSSTPFHQPAEIFEGLERPNFSLSGASLRISPVPVKSKKAVESDSEDWSEPDRDVSQQRIGLELADSDYVHQKDTFTDSDVQAQSHPKPSPRKIKENIRELRVLRHHIRQLKSSAKIMRDELQVYEYLCSQLQQVLPTIQPPEGKQGGLLDHLYEMTGMVLDLTEKRRLVDDLVEKQESLKKLNEKTGRGALNCEDDSLQAESDPRKSLSSDQYKRVVADHKNAIGELKLLCDRLQKKMTNQSVDDSRVPSSAKAGTVGKLELKLRKANSTIKDLQEKGMLMKESLMRKEARLAEKDSEITRLGFVIKEKEFSTKEFSVKIAELEREKLQLQKIADNLKVTSRCSEQCSNLLKEAKSENSRLALELEAFKRELNTANSVVKSLDEEVASLKDQQTVSEEVAEKFRALEKSFESLTFEKNSLQAELSERINEISIRNSTIENLMGELGQKNQELEHIRNQLENAEACINNFESARQNYIEHISSSESVPRSPKLGSSSNLARPSGFLLGKREDPASTVFTESPSGSGRFFNQSAQRVVSSKVSQSASSSTFAGDGTSLKEHVRRQYSEISEMSETTIDEMQDVTSLSFKGFVPARSNLLAPDALLSPTEVKSPDLGIESDPTSRFSSLGNNPDKQHEDKGLDLAVSPTMSCKNCAILYTKYQKAKKALAVTAEKLRISNERKEKIDKALNKELVKTHGVLKQAKGYLELCHTNVSKNN